MDGRKCNVGDKGFLRKIEGMLKRDPLLQPYFEKGYIHVVEKEGADPVWIDPGVKDEIWKFITERVNADLLGLGDDLLEDSVRLWDDREKMKKAMEEDEVLGPYFRKGTISMLNKPDKGSFEMDADLPVEEAILILERAKEILKEEFGL